MPRQSAAFPARCACPTLAGDPTGETVANRCRYYRTVLQLTAMPSAGGERIVVPSGRVSGLIVPAEIGQQICRQLSRRDLLGPVIAHPQAGRLTILTGPDGGLEHDYFASLLQHLNACIAPSSIVLPSPADERAGFRRWIVDPGNNFRPPLPDVVDIALEISR